MKTPKKSRSRARKAKQERAEYFWHKVISGYLKDKQQKFYENTCAGISGL